MAEQVGPAPGTRVAGGDHRYRKWPRYCKVRVVEGDGQVLGRVMRSIDPIAHIGHRAERLEAMQETGRDIQVPKLAVVEEKSLMPAEGRRVSTDVDQHIVDCAVGAAHQLRFASPSTTVHAADDSLHGTGLGVLDERGGVSRRANVIVEDVRIERPSEQSTFVAEWLRHKGENISEGRLFNTHMGMLT